MDLDSIKENHRELLKLYLTVQEWHTKFQGKNIANVSDLEVYFLTLYPVLSHKDKDVFEALFAALTDTVVDVGLMSEYLRTLKERQVGHRLVLNYLECSDGTKTLNDAVIESSSILEGLPTQEQEANPFVSGGLREVYNVTAKDQGLRWPLKCLNQMLGSLRKGDYGFIFARPETGKTTFVAHVATCMAQQTEKPVIWFNNEQEGHVVQAYCYRAALGLTNQQLYAKIEENEKSYKDLGYDRIRIYDSAAIHRSEVEALLRRFGASLIIFDQIDKIKGFDTDRDDLELGAIYQWARELAKRFAPVIGVCQAGATGSNKRYLDMTDVVNAKTSKQAEADWILGIGKVELEGYEKVRHFHVCKNKLTGDSDTVPEMRHGRIDVLINAEISRYEDIK